MLVIENDDTADKRQKSVVQAKRELFVSQGMHQCLDFIPSEYIRVL